MFKHFEGKNNAEVYCYAFNSLLMRKFPGREHFFLGNSQREQFLPSLNQILIPYKKRESCRILDVGAGSGDIVDLCLQFMPHAIVSIEEPNQLLLENYLRRIKHHANLELGEVYPGFIQDLLQRYDGRRWMQMLPEQQIILAIHMIYHLTDFNTDKAIDPEHDLIETISALYERLSVGGTLFLVYAEQLESITGRVSYEYFLNKSSLYANNIKKIWAARKHLLRDGGIEPVLQKRYSEVRPILNNSITMSRIYAYNESELAIMCLASEMGTSDYEKFNVDKLHFSLDSIRKFDIVIESEEGPRKGMFSASQPQVICIIKKTKC